MNHDNPGEPIRVMLVEDHASFRQALAFFLERGREFAVAAEAGTLAEARETLEGQDTTNRIDAAVVDLALPDGNGADLIGDLRRVNPTATVLILSATLSPANFTRALEAGASGIVDKMAGVEEIISALRRHRAGEALPSQRAVVELLRIYARRRGESGDTLADVDVAPREREVLQALAEGLDSEGIAGRLHIPVEEEEDRVAGILEKLGARSRFQALAIAAGHGLVEIPRSGSRV